MPSAGCPGGSVPHIVLAVGSVRVEPCARSAAAAGGHRVCAREGQEGTLDPAVPVRGLPRGLGQAGGSACQPAEADACHL